MNCHILDDIVINKATNGSSTDTFNITKLTVNVQTKNL